VFDSLKFWVCVLVFLFFIFSSLPLFIFISIYKKMKGVSVYLFLSLHKFYPCCNQPQFGIHFQMYTVICYCKIIKKMFMTISFLFWFSCWFIVWCYSIMCINIIYILHFVSTGYEIMIPSLVLNTLFSSSFCSHFFHSDT
jgi:hypothetical protein